MKPGFTKPRWIRTFIRYCGKDDQKLICKFQQANVILQRIRCWGCPFTFPELDLHVRKDMFLDCAATEAPINIVSERVGPKRRAKYREWVCDFIIPKLKKLDKQVFERYNDKSYRGK